MQRKSETHEFWVLKAKKVKHLHLASCTYIYYTITDTLVDINVQFTKIHVDLRKFQCSFGLINDFLYKVILHSCKSHSEWYDYVNTYLGPAHCYLKGTQIHINLLKI